MDIYTYTPARPVPPPTPPVLRSGGGPTQGCACVLAALWPAQMVQPLAVVPAELCLQPCRWRLLATDGV